MAQMKLIPADNMKDKLWGKRGTPEREAMETKLKEDVNAYIPDFVNAPPKLKMVF